MIFLSILTFNEFIREKVGEALTILEANSADSGESLSCVFSAQNASILF